MVQDANGNAPSSDFEVSNGFAVLNLVEDRISAGLKLAVEHCRAKSRQTSALLIVAAQPEQVGDSGRETAPDDDAGEEFLSLLQGLQRLELVVVGFVMRSVSCVESCIFSACDTVDADRDVAFEISKREAPSSVVPLLLFRALCPLSFGAGDECKLPRHLGCAEAEQLGLVTCSMSGRQTQERLQDLRKRLAESPASTATSLRWELRRRRRAHVRWGLGGAEFPGAGRKRLAAPEPACRRKLARVGPGAGGAEGHCHALAAGLVSCMSDTPQLLHFVESVVGAGFGVPGGRGGRNDVICSLVQAAVEKLHADLKRSFTDLDDELRTNDFERVGRESAIASAESLLETSFASLAAKKAKLVDLSCKLRAAVNRVSRARDAQEHGDADWYVWSLEQEKLEDAEESFYIPLKIGTVSAQKAKKHMVALVTAAKESQLDATLLEGLPGALNHKPGFRTDFDNVVLTAFESQLSARMAELEQLQSDAAPGKEARARALEKAQHEHHELKTEHDLCMQEVKQAEEIVKEAKHAVENCSIAVKSFDPELQELAAQQVLAKVALHDFENGPLRAFQLLQDPTLLERAASAGGPCPGNDQREVCDEQSCPDGTDDGAVDDGGSTSAI